MNIPLKGTLKYRILADFVLGFHIAFVIFAIACLPLTFMVGWYRYVTLAFVAILTFSWIVWDGCVLAILEDALRRRYNQYERYAKTPHSFLAYYVRKYFAKEVSPKAVDWTTYGFLVVLVVVSIVQP